MTDLAEYRKSAKYPAIASLFVASVAVPLYNAGMARKASVRAAAVVLPLLDRPMPPPAMAAGEGPAFLPAPEIVDWLQRAFLDEAGPLYSAEHIHLAEAHIACLWTSVENSRQGRRIVGMAEMPSRSNNGGKWQRARVAQQIEQWFGAEPDFLLTFDALHAAEADDVTWCSLVSHEMFHCGQATDEFGQPKFSRQTGEPIFAMRAHDAEEFIGVVRQFGATPDVQALIDAAAQAPAISGTRIAQACGICARRAA